MNFCDIEPHFQDEWNVSEYNNKDWLVLYLRFVIVIVFNKRELYFLFVILFVVVHCFESIQDMYTLARIICFCLIIYHMCS